MISANLVLVIEFTSLLVSSSKYTSSLLGLRVRCGNAWWRLTRPLTCRSLEALSLINPYIYRVTDLVSFAAWFLVFSLAILIILPELVTLVSGLPTSHSLFFLRGATRVPNYFCRVEFQSRAYSAQCQDTLIFFVIALQDETHRRLFMFINVCV